MIRRLRARLLARRRRRLLDQVAARLQPHTRRWWTRTAPPGPPADAPPPRLPPVDPAQVLLDYATGAGLVRNLDEAAPPPPDQEGRHS